VATAKRARTTNRNILIALGERLGHWRASRVAVKGWLGARAFALCPSVLGHTMNRFFPRLAGQVLTSAAGARRCFGGYIEDAQLAMLGKEIFEDLHGPRALVPPGFVVPSEDSDWPCNLWGHALHESVVKHGLQQREQQQPGTATEEKKK